MAIPVLLIIAGAIGLFVFQRQQHSRRLALLREGWGQPHDRERDMTAIAAYHRVLNAGSQTVVDDRTWSDLLMDDVFAAVDRTQSGVGQQLLYARLRTRSQPDQNAAFEQIVTRLTEDPSTRERAQLALNRLRAPAGYDLWRLTRPQALEVVWWHWLFPVSALVMVAAAVMTIVAPPFALLLIAGALGGLIARTVVSRSLQVVTGAFRQVSPLLTIAGTLATCDLGAPASFVGTLREDVRRLARLKRVASWASRDSSGALGGDLAGIVLEYLNLVFWLDANALFFGARELRARAPELLRAIAAVGDIDAALAIASYRTGTDAWSRPVFQADLPAFMTDLRHPLLPDAVPNSVAMGPPHGVIVTGSNMSGKSTFLRTVGVSALLAQSINTCPASRYEAPVFTVRSCIGRGDDLLAGKSYYLAEVESVLDLVTSAGTGARHLLLFDELFRGTNAVERIAAGEAVLRALLQPGPEGQPPPHVVLAATHDQELVDLLAPVYVPFHFSDTIDERGLAFDYTLKPGRATTRNAIALLAHCGAPARLVEDARARADSLDGVRAATQRPDRQPTLPS